MPRYFFDLTNGSRDPDAVGVELVNIGTAWTQAVVFAGETLKEHPGKVWDGSELHVEVRDESGMMLFIVTCFVTDSPAAIAALRRR